MACTTDSRYRDELDQYTLFHHLICHGIDCGLAFYLPRRVVPVRVDVRPTEIEWTVRNKDVVPMRIVPLELGHSALDGEGRVHRRRRQS